MDDLCEDIFEVFPLEECIKYEGVSKQWKRTIYKRINKFVIRDNESVLMKSLFSERQLREGMPALPQLLAKCQNIIYFYTESQPHFETYPQLNAIIAELIAKFCLNLKSINNSSVGLSHNSAKTFIESIEHKLESICLYHSKQNFEELIGQRFPKLRRLTILSLIDESLSESSFSITKLTYLKIYSPTIDENYLTIIRSNKRLECLNLSCFLDDNTSEELLTELSDLSDLKSLKISLAFDLKSKTIFKKFKIIGQKCHKLKIFDFNLSQCELDCDPKILQLIEYYPYLDTFKLMFYDIQINKYLRIKMRYDLGYELTLWTTNHIQINEDLIDYIEKLVNLRELVIGTDNEQVQVNPVLFYKLFRDCGRLKTVHLLYESNVNNDDIRIERSDFGSIIQKSRSQTWTIFDPLI